ncbi:MAG TPA: hypothetical protein VLB05_08565 [Dongiaceae bacterium]|nr:hypothetical protein [Dongiaceae bacterium]
MPDSRPGTDDPRQNVEALIRLAAEGRLGPGISVTCRGKNDGAGAQAIAAISAMTLARLTGCAYRHSPFTTMSHTGGDRADWAQSWERFLNLGHGETPVPPDAELVPLAAMVRDPDAHAGRAVVIAERVYRIARSRAWPIHEQLRTILRRRYWLSSKAGLPVHDDPPHGLTAAVHVRRGDVTADHPWRYVADDRILRSIERLQAAVAAIGRPLRVDLYSEGDPADFAAFARAGCRLHIGTDAQETFHNMVAADLLVRAPGNFSELAGLLSQGVVITPSVHSAPLSGTLRRRANGDFSIKGLQRMLLARAGWMERRKFQVRRWWRRLLS